jgi:hypothetical protein
MSGSLSITPVLLAARLRQSVQGCTLHLHGPVQAWLAIMDASREHRVDPLEVGGMVVASCQRRVHDLESQGALFDDPRIMKERRTMLFVSALLSVPLPKDKDPRMSSNRQHSVLRDSVVPHLDLVTWHPLYSRIKTVEHVRTFMEHHVFAVWDFMCLLKSLQRVTTSVTVPWVPTGDPETRRFVNETVLDEESDVLPDGSKMSHFEMYLDAMREVGADTTCVTQFVDMTRDGHLLHVAMQKAKVPEPARDFVMTTMDIINVGRAHSICAAFTVGREQAIPAMFMKIIEQLHEPSDHPMTKLLYYLQRHVSIDGDKHGPIAAKMLENLCGDAVDRWLDATGTAVMALQARKRLWDAVAERLT